MKDKREKEAMVGGPVKILTFTTCTYNIIVCGPGAQVIIPF